MKPIFKKGLIGNDPNTWESRYHDVMPHQFVCYEDWDNDEVWSWCLANLGTNMNWMVCFSGVMLRNEDDAVLFMLRWC